MVKFITINLSQFITINLSIYLYTDLFFCLTFRYKLIINKQTEQITKIKIVKYQVFNSN
jgi:hypothetical protein